MTRAFLYSSACLLTIRQLALEKQITTLSASKMTAVREAILFALAL